MKKQNLLWIIVLVILLLIAFFVVFSQNETAKKVRNAISFSLEEDFKIKESLGKVFFVEKEEDSVNVSANITVSTLSLPSENCSLDFYLGQPYLKIECSKYSSIVATGDGIIESISNNRVTIRHYDGKLSEYKNVCAILKTGEKVIKGDSIGYSIGNSTYKLYENCKTLNPEDYIS